ncbi:MAG: chloride channel protein [Planctomycetaceae bacterium]|nr:chloride channel protein [Planctomycetaceae bacterium]
MSKTPAQPSASDSAPTASAGKRASRASARLLARLGLTRERRLLLWAALTGVALAVIALAFIRPIQWAEHAAVEWAAAHPDRVPMAVALVPILGALLCGAIQLVFKVKIRAHGVSSVLYAIHRRRSQIPGVLAARTWLGSSAIIASGGSAGPEGPIVTIGATLGSMISRLMRADPQTATTLVGCGAAAGLAAVFNAPLTGIFFVLEVLLRDFSLRAFTPIAIAAVFAAATVQTLIGDQQPLFGVGFEMLSQGGAGLNIKTAPAFALLGIACGVASVFFIRTLQASESSFQRLPFPRWMMPAIGAGILALLGTLHVVYAKDYLDFGQGAIPPFYGNGYPLAKAVLEPAFYAKGTALVVAALLVGLAVVKCVATSLTLGSGGIGGLFAPSLLVGALVGGAFGSMGELVPFVSEAGPARLALAGMAGVVAGTTHAPLAGAMLVYELSRESTILLPVILVAAIATIVARLFERHSLYTAELAALGVRLGSGTDLSQLRRLRVGDVPLKEAVTVRGSAPATSIVALADTDDEFVVLDDAGRLEGIVGARDLRIALVNREALPLLQVRDIARTGIRAIDKDLPLDHALDMLERGPLPVKDESGAIAGILTRSRLMRTWRRNLERER